MKVGGSRLKKEELSFTVANFFVPLHAQNKIDNE